MIGFTVLGVLSAVALGVHLLRIIASLWIVFIASKEEKNALIHP